MSSSSIKHKVAEEMRRVTYNITLTIAGVDVNGSAITQRRRLERQSKLSCNSRRCDNDNDITMKITPIVSGMMPT